MADTLLCDPQGQQLDLSAFLADGSFKMTLRGHFEVACRTGPDGSCRLSARALGGGPPCSSPSLAAAVGEQAAPSAPLGTASGPLLCWEAAPCCPAGMRTKPGGGGMYTAV